tara:strand:- start:353 stop:619 length:267 start_codon:yes stop_codon:yes gene_type:complete
MTDFWDRKLLKTQQELKAIQSGLKRAKGDRKEMARQLKKTKRYFRSSLAEVARLDDSIYNVKKSPQESDARELGEETQGSDLTDREST